MKFVYDILLNLNDELYEFYEWSIDDDIEYLKKIPLFKIKNDDYKKIKMDAIIDDNSFINSIYNITEIYDNKRIRLVNYACLFTNGKEVVGVLLNKIGKIIMISKLYIDEESEVLDIAYAMKEMDFNVIDNSIERDNDNVFMTRNEEQKRNFLLVELNNLYASKNVMKLKYLYYECSNEIEGNIDNIYSNIKRFLDREWDSKHDELYNLVRLSYSKK